MSFTDKMCINSVPPSIIIYYLLKCTNLITKKHISFVQDDLETLEIRYNKKKRCSGEEGTFKCPQLWGEWNGCSSGKLDQMLTI